MQQLRDVLQADVAGEQFLVVEHAHATVTADLVAIEGEIDLFDAVTLGTRAELGFSPWRSAAEQDAVGWCHRPE
jgi:hypothetical protein